MTCRRHGFLGEISFAMNGDGNNNNKLPEEFLSLCFSQSSSNIWRKFPTPSHNIQYPSGVRREFLSADQQTIAFHRIIFFSFSLSLTRSLIQLLFYVRRFLFEMLLLLSGSIHCEIPLSRSFFSLCYILCHQSILFVVLLFGLSSR